MPEIKCDVCGITFTRRDSLTNHYKTASHKKAVASNNVSTIITTTKKEENFVINSDIEILKKQMQLQQDLIQKLMRADEPFTNERYLNETCKDAINFDEFFSMYEPYLCNPNMNKWIITGGCNYDIYMCLRYIEVGYYPKTEDFMADMFCGALNKMEHTKKPIYCVSDREGIYYYKTNGKWEEIEKPVLLKKIFNRLTSMINNAIINTRQFSREYEKEFKKQYGKDANWLMRNGGELSLTCWVGAEVDKFISVCHKKLCKITSKDQAELEESKPHHWNEYKDIIQNHNDSDSD